MPTELSMTKKRKPSAEQLIDIHAEAIQRFDEAFAYERDQRDEGIEDIRFSQNHDGQWDDSALRQRRDRPRYTINKISHAVNQIVGDMRQNDIAVKVRPASDGADQKRAEIFQGFIRNIENISHADSAYQNASKEQITGGFGAWRVVTEFTDNDVFEQDICIKPIRSAMTSVYFMPTATDPQKRDSDYCFVTEEISRETFKKRYPKATLSDFKTTNLINRRNLWSKPDTVRIAEYWRKVPVTKELGLLSDGRVIDLQESALIIDELAAAGVQVIRTRTVKTKAIEFYLISGSEIIEGPLEWAGKHIPIIPVYGYEFYLEGKHKYRGITRLARDAQRIYNYSVSANIETVALSPKDPYWLTPKQAAGQERQLQTFNVTNKPFMLYNHDKDEPGPPRRTGAPQVQQALIAQAEQADLDLQATLGRFAPTQGDQVNNQSGRAILALQQRGDVATFELMDNLAKGIEYTGEILVDLIPKIYDTERQIRILKEDGQTESVTINQTVVDRETGETVKLNDLSMGKFDVVVDVGPAYATKRTEAINTLNTLAQSNPLFSQVASDLIAKNVDFPFSAELEQRIRKQLLAQGVVDPTEEEIQQLAQQQPQQPDPAQLIQLESLKLNLEILAAQVDRMAIENDNLQIDSQKKRAEIQKLLTETLQKKADTNKTLAEIEGPAVIPVSPDEIDARQTNMDLLNADMTQEETQKIAEQAQQLAQALPPEQPQPPII